MAKRTSFTDAQLQELQGAYTQEKDGPTRTRLQAVRLYGQGYVVAEILALTTSSRGALMQWCRKYRTAGLPGLQDHRGGPQAAKLSPADLTDLGEKLRQYRPYDVFGPQSHTARGATGPRRTWPRRPRTRSSWPRTKPGCICKRPSWPSGTRWARHRWYGWTRDAAKSLFYGSLNLQTGEELATRTTELNASVTAQHLQQVLTSYPGQRIVLFWDRAPRHRGLAIREVLAANPRLEIVEFPTGSPDLNPQEQVWKRTRRAVRHNHVTPKLLDLADRVEAHLTAQTFRSSFLEQYGF